MTTTIGLVLRPDLERAVPLAQELIAWASKKNFKVLLEEESARAIGSKEKGVNAHQLTHEADPIITLGGDGTLIGLARHVNNKSPVLIGVNFGTLGFLTEIAPAELFNTLEKVLNGEARLERRNMIFAEVLREDKAAFSSQAINDVVIQKGARDKLLELDLTVGGEGVMRLRADGLIIATPTGSTAYSLAAGGSIAHPSLEVFLITPICPHSLTNRPLLLSLDESLEITIPHYDGDVSISVDGQVSMELKTGDVVRVKRARHVVHCAKSASKSYFEILRTKLNWGIPNRSE